jgi:hypothetical protein
MNLIETKIYFPNNQIKRVFLEEEFSFETLQNKIINSKEPLQFLDEDDEWFEFTKLNFPRCTIDSEETWKECKIIWKNLPTPKTLKIKIQVDKTTEFYETIQETFTSIGTSICDFFKSMSASLTSPSPIVHLQEQLFQNNVQQEVVFKNLPPNVIYRPVLVSNKTEETKPIQPIIQEFSEEFKMKLKLLEDMGFEDEEMNISLLKKHGNDIQLVVQESLFRMK